MNSLVPEIENIGSQICNQGLKIIKLKYIK